MFRCVICGREASGQPVRCPRCSGRASYLPLSRLNATELEPRPPKTPRKRVEPEPGADDAPELPETLPAPAEPAQHGLVIIPATDAADVDEPERLPTGIAQLDRVFGGDETPGYARGRFYLLGGRRGCGKSRLLMQLCGVVGGVVVSAEDQAADLLLRASHVLDHAARSRVQLVAIQAGCGLDAFGALLRELRPRFAMLDSMQAVAGDLLADQLRASIALWNLARETDCAIFANSQMNAEGRMRGSEAIQQWCDGIFGVERVEGREGVVRVSCGGKNRHGPDHITACLTHTARGLVATSHVVEQQGAA